MAGQNSLALAAGPPVGGTAELRPPRAVLPPFSEIYRQYFDFVWSSVRHLGVSSTAIDDVVQEAFIVIHQRLHTLQQPESLRSWIYGVVRRTVSGHRRANRPDENAVARYEAVAPTLSASPTTPLDVAEQNAQLELLSSLLAELDEAKREIFILAELEEMSVPEIAEALEIPLNTAYSRLRAARQGFEAALSRRAARLQEKGLR
jgi:RNA polymerase sigma-70 factor (ECF subfamily)